MIKHIVLFKLKEMPEKLTFRRLMKFDGREVTEIENA